MRNIKLDLEDDVISKYANKEDYPIVVKALTNDEVAIKKNVRKLLSLGIIKKVNKENDAKNTK